MRYLKRWNMALGLAAMLVVVCASVVFAQEGSNIFIPFVSSISIDAAAPPGSIEAQQSSLLQELFNFAEELVARSDTTFTKTEDGVTLTGDSAERLNKKQDEIAKKLDTLTARPAEARQGAVEKIVQFSTGVDSAASNSLEYQMTAVDLNTIDEREVEWYSSSQFIYGIDPDTHTITHMASTEDYMPYANAAGTTLSEEELEQKAIAFVKANNLCFDEKKDELQLEVGSKQKDDIELFFFRWEQAEQAEQATYVRVGIAQDGTVFGYVDADICAS